MSSLPRQSTPVPNYLLDTVMPTLTDTEWRVLCVVVRATLGWQAGNAPERKTSDWLTQSQLKARTGRASEAISRAISGLVEKDLLEVRSETGQPLLSAKERQRCSGKLLYCLAPRLLDAPQSPVSTGQEEERNELSLSTECSYSESEQDCSDIEHTASKSEQGYSQTEQGCSEIEVRKANTTKESYNKITPKGVSHRSDQAVDNPVDKSPTARKANSASPPNPEVRQFLHAYQELFARHSAQGESPPIAWGRDSKLVKELLAQYGYERLVELLDLFFQSTDPWVKQRGFALSCFPTLLPRLLMGETRSGYSSRCVQATPVVLHREQASHWQQAADIAVSSVSLFERFPDLAHKLRGQPP